MNNNNFDPNQETTNPFMKKKAEESLEISTTGYGFESVSKETGEDRTKQQTKGTNPSCGGL